MSRKSSSRGARTRACRIHTRVNARGCVRANTRACARVNPELGICTRPLVILDPRNQPRLHGIPLDIPSNPTPLLLIANPMIVRLTLPKLLAGSVQQSIRIARRRSFERFQELGWRDQRPQEHVNMVCHDYEGPQLVVVEFNSAVQGIDNELRDAGLPKELGARPRVVEITVNPGEGFSRCGLGGWRKLAGRKASVQRPGDEQPMALGIGVRKATARVHESLVALRARKSRVHMSVDDGRPGRTALSRDKQGLKGEPVADAARRSACAT